MQQNKLDYLKLVLFLASITLTTMGYCISLFITTAQTEITLYAMLTSLFVVFAANSVTNIWLQKEFEKRTVLAKNEFFGHLYYVNNVKVDAGRNIRISTFFFLFITAPTIISQEWYLAIPFSILGLIFALHTMANVKEFNSYIDKCVIPLSIISK